MFLPEIGGFMEELDKKWIINPELITSERSKICQTEEKIPTTLGLENMHDAFYLIAAGMCTVFTSSRHSKR